jgi:purine-nucleoside phosphorylase
MTPTATQPATDLRRHIDEALASIRERSAMSPSVVIVLGTGLGGLAEKVKDATIIPYEEIANFPVSTVVEHEGKLVLGTLAGREVAVMQGRHHCYEGYTPQEVVFPVRVLRALGADTLIITNAVGGMNPLMPPGTIVAVIDHINLMGLNPLIGPNEDSIGPRFPDMSEPYSRDLVALAERVALEKQMTLAKGVLVGVVGPNLETAAEYRFLRQIGGDVVSMSMVPENIAAIHAGMRVLGFSVVTDSCLPDALKPANIEEIVRTANETGPRLDALIQGVLAQLDEA